MLVWKTLLTHSPSPIAGTSTTSSRGIGCGYTGCVSDPASVAVAIKEQIESVTAELEASLCKLLADFVEAGDAEILAFQQIVARAAEQLANGR